MPVKAPGKDGIASTITASALNWTMPAYWKIGKTAIIPLFTKKIDLTNMVLARHKLDTSEKIWEGFPKEQIDVVTEVCQLLKDTCNIREMAGHDDISPTYKRDPGPAFPMQELKSHTGLE
ncbi:MAG: hypothetical protein PHI28_11620 [Mangrovibacterium sp.]|nr:hypothetical protein [Mangrovibacterium sp.]